MKGIWDDGEMALSEDPPRGLEGVGDMPDGGKIQQLAGVPSGFAPDAPEEMMEIARKLTEAAR
jgi:Mn-containing catalase